MRDDLGMMAAERRGAHSLRTDPRAHTVRYNRRTVWHQSLCRPSTGGAGRRSDVSREGRSSKA